jgi:hypothetical protein
MPLVRTALCAALLLAGCHSTQLTEISCADPCQDAADPFTLRLVVAYDDPDRALEGATVTAQVDHRTALSVPADGLTTPAGGSKGTMRLDVPVKVNKIADGQRFQVDVRTDGPKGGSNFVSGTFVWKL